MYEYIEDTIKLFNEKPISYEQLSFEMFSAGNQRLSTQRIV